MKTKTLLKKNAIKPELLVGTKWISWGGTFGDRFSVEFIDKSHCIYTSQPKRFPLTYTVKEGKMFISNIKGVFELEGDVLFNNDIPSFQKAS